MTQGHLKEVNIKEENHKASQGQQLQQLYGSGLDLPKEEIAFNQMEDVSLQKSIK